MHGVSFVRKHGLDTTSDLTEARHIAGLSVADCIELCDVSKRTWYRWSKEGAPTWAVRLILSCHGTLDRFGWPDWEMRGGRLYYNQLSHRYFWDPMRLVMPLYGVHDPAILWQHYHDNVAGIDRARELKQAEISSLTKELTLVLPKPNCA
jgi:hypothetical protein